MTLEEKHTIGVSQTALFNANRAGEASTQNSKSIENQEVSISELEDIGYDQEIRITCLELGIDRDEVEAL